MNRRGFTLVELLVVIVIIGILMSLLLPAVNSVRENMRGMTCKNNLGQLAKGFDQHLGKYGYYPSGGWGWAWVGDADRSAGRRQPGAWGFSVLPFIEKKNLYNLASDGDPDSMSEAQKEGAGRMTATPVSIMNCPSRRVPSRLANRIEIINATRQELVARTDYAVNGGMRGYYFWRGESTIAAEQAHEFAYAADCHGISYYQSEIGSAKISDGLSNTYMIGEKYLNPDAFYLGSDGADNESMYSGFNNDNHRTGMTPPMPDRPGIGSQYAFGSSHPDALNMAFCDGRVRTVSYNIDPELHWLLSDRDDGRPASLIR